MTPGRGFTACNQIPINGSGKIDSFSSSVPGMRIIWILRALQLAAAVAAALGLVAILEESRSGPSVVMLGVCVFGLCEALISRD